MPRGDRELLTSLMRDATETPPTEQEEFSPNSNLALDQLLRGVKYSDTFAPQLGGTTLCHLVASSLFLQIQ